MTCDFNGNQKTVTSIETVTVYMQGPCEFLLKQVSRNIDRYGIVRIVRPSHDFNEETMMDIITHLGILRSEQNDFKDKIKKITPTAEGRGLSGDTNSELPYHVDGPQDLTPPDLLAFMYGRPATSGGMSKFLDSRLLLEEFIKKHGKEKFYNLAVKDSVSYKKGDVQFLGQILNIDSFNNIYLRLRLSEPGLTFNHEPTHESWKELVRLSEEIEQLKFLPNSGDLIVFDNKRYLHARDVLTVCNGERFHYRAWMDVNHKQNSIKTGITVSNDMVYEISTRNRGLVYGKV